MAGGGPAGGDATEGGGPAGGDATAGGGPAAADEAGGGPAGAGDTKVGVPAPTGLATGAGSSPSSRGGAAIAARDGEPSLPGVRDSAATISLKSCGEVAACMASSIVMRPACRCS